MATSVYIPCTLSLLKERCRPVYALAKSHSYGRYAEVVRNFIAGAVFFYPGAGVYFLWLACVGLPTLRCFLWRTREVPHSHF
jgi:hypothetical protein